MPLHFDLARIQRLPVLKSRLSELYMNIAIHSFAVSLVNIFVPIYLLKLGFSLQSVLVFCILYYGFIAVASPFCALLANRWGFKHIILFRLPITLFYFMGLLLLENYPIPVHLLAIFGGVDVSLYAVSMNSLFAQYSNKKNRSTEFSKYISVPQVAAIVGPTIGGFIAVKLGFTALFAVSIVIIMASMIPLFFTPDMKPHVNFSVRYLLGSGNKKFARAFFAEGVKFTGGAVLWPILVYFVLHDVLAVGYMATFGAVGVIIFTLVIGRLSDRVSRSSIMMTGGILHAFTYFVRVLAETAGQVFSVTFTAGLFTTMIDVPFNSIFYDRANEMNPSEFVVLREIWLGVGRIATMAAVILLAGRLSAGIIISGFGSLFFYFFSRFI